MSPTDMTRAQALEFVLRHRPSLTLTMRGRSMEPLLRAGMCIDVSPLQRRPRVGEIAVFREGDRWVAHRVVRVLPAGLLCAGDAQPESVERVDDAAVFGVVSAVRATAGGPRCDGVWFRAHGHLLARLRRFRAWWRVASPMSREPVYARLVDAASAMVREDAGALRRAVEAVLPWKLAAVAKRHRLEPMIGRAVLGVSDSPYTRALAARLAPDRYRVLLAAPRYRRQVEEVLAILRTAGVEPVFLKSAARILAGERDAELFSPQDIDLLVDERELEAARNALHAHGYVERKSRADYEKHHHIAPLFPPSGVPVEIHHRLSRYPTGGSPWNKAALAPFVTRTPDAPHASVLDAVGASIHHALHAYIRAELREMTVFARRLLDMTPAQHDQFRELLAGETRERVRIEAAAAFAAALAGISWPVSTDVRTSLRWSIMREDLPRPLRAYPACVDAWLAYPDRRVTAAIRAAFEGAPSARPLRRALMRLGCAVLIAFYTRIQSARTSPSSQN